MIASCNNGSVKPRPSDERRHSGPPGHSSAAFLLAQVGAHAASQFGARLSVKRLTPAHAGILRILQFAPAITQQALAEKLGMVPSRLVTLLDELESLGFVERGNNPADRRRHALQLTPPGREALAAIGDIARDHQRTLLAALSAEEQRQLAALLERVAQQQGLTPGVHPGYRTLRDPARGGEK